MRLTSEIERLLKGLKKLTRLGQAELLAQIAEKYGEGFAAAVWREFARRYPHQADR